MPDTLTQIKLITLPTQNYSLPIQFYDPELGRIRSFSRYRRIKVIQK
jgi:hypothetical protein